MKISIENGFEDLRNELMALGYEVYNFSDNTPSDVYIYSKKIKGLNSLNNFISPGPGGSLLIDGDGKSLSEIQYILRNRIYSPLFNITSSPSDHV